MIKETILSMLSKNGFISGEQISNQLKISRTAVWKHIKTLKEQGYEIESKRNKGYRLITRPDLTIPEEIIPRLNTKIIGKYLYHFSSLDSTNIYAKKIIKKMIPEGTIIITDMQTKGRGRKERSWISPVGGLWFSVILFPNIPPQKAMYITMAASVAIVKAINDVCGISSEIKWPNDILISGKKVCGILTELDAELDRINHTIIGIGINVNNDIPKELKNSATSLKNNIGSNISKIDLLCSILNHFDLMYIQVKNFNLEFIRDSWLHLSNLIGKKISVKNEKEIIMGRVIDIDENGCLLVSENNRIKHIISGDIDYIN
jgi:BirA family biotin operon repressor/biotin-[acetyl-CoA-carboxylase] ligase